MYSITFCRGTAQCQSPNLTGKGYVHYVLYDLLHGHCSVSVSLIWLVREKACPPAGAGMLFGMSS
jgi:hypothetical protein